uniref:Uncharacterized protein n=1 Tax=Phascolarctos cinereus TaxID=38626 RepID=A0A6P5IX61_PHACI|nr:putative uncharacterized protein C8orf89 homolog [Phascolarctos cinereus]
MSRSDRSREESCPSALNYLLSTCSLRRDISSFSKEENKIPVLTPENRYLTSRVTKSSLDGCFFFENSWKKAALETLKMKKECSSVFGLKDFKEVGTIPSLPEVQRYRKNTESPLDVLKRHPYTPLKTPKIRSMKSNQTGSMLSLQEKTKRFSFRSPLTGAPPEYLQRLSELAILEYDTIRQETSKKFKKVKKRECPDC